MKCKIITAILLSISINTYATTNATVQDPYATLYQRQSRPISNHYDYSINNTTSIEQTYHLHADLCPSAFKCKEIDRNVVVSPGQSVADNFNIQMDVYYLNPGTVPIYASLVIIGESNLDIRRNGFIYIRA